MPSQTSGPFTRAAGTGCAKAKLLAVIVVLAAAPAVILRKLNPIDNTIRIESAHALGDFPLFILATQTETSALQGWYRIAQMVTIISAICVVVVLIAAYGMGRWWKEQRPPAA